MCMVYKNLEAFAELLAEAKAGKNCLRTFAVINMYSLFPERVGESPLMLPIAEIRSCEFIS